MSDFFHANQAALARRFPAIARQLRDMPNVAADCQTNTTAEGKVVTFRGQPLDHPAYPRQAAHQWASRAVSSLLSRDTPVLLFGFGGGYHVEALLQSGIPSLSVYEPSLSVLRCALESRDLRTTIEQLSGLWVGSIPEAVSADTQLVIRALSQAAFPGEWEEIRRRVYAARGSENLKPNVAILGPLQGGSLPILSYVHHALVRMGIRARAINVSPMASGYHQVSSILKDRVRQQIAEGAYVEYLSNLVVDSINERPVDIFICLAQAPITIKALQRLRSMGVITVLWFVEDYQRFSYWHPFAPHYDFIFTIQKDPCISAMKSAGAPQVHYLPVGCDPVVHAPSNLSADDRGRWGSPISFVGAGYHNRQQVFAALSQLPFKIWGTEWPTGKPFNRMVQEGGRRLTPAEYTKIFNSTDININLHSSSERDGVDPFGDFVNPRTFELAASGAFQLVDRRTLLPELFSPGEELITFRSVTELKELIDYYMAHPDERAVSVLRTRTRALAEHTYEHRMRAMLATIYGVKYDYLVDRQRLHPWSKLLESGKAYPKLLTRLERAYERGDEPSLDALVGEISVGSGTLDQLDQELLFLHHVKQNMILKTPGETSA